MNNIITVSDAEDLNQRYVDTRSLAIDQDLGYTDKRNFNFSIQELKDFIEIVETDSNNLGYENIGITIFMGAYDATVDDPSFATVFLSASRDDGGMISKAIDPLNYARPRTNNY